MSKYKPLILFILIIFTAVFLRFYKLGSVPASPDWDEAALGYNAYSILKTGRDEYGTKFPLSLRSFDDYKPPLYVYLTVPSVALFGLSTWSTRLPSAVMGVLAVVGVYFLVRQLFINQFQISNFKFQIEKNHKNKRDLSIIIAFISSFLLAISPWHIQFSRIAFEANIGITINIWAVYTFLRSFRDVKINMGYLVISAFLFGLGFYAYHSERIFLPLIVLLLLYNFKDFIFTKKSIAVFAVFAIVGLAVVLPLVPVVLNKSALLRLRGTSSFTDQTGLLYKTVEKIEFDRSRGDKIGELLDNRRFVYAKTLLNGYLSHFSFKWLFLEGDNPRHHAPDMGLLYLWELPFVLIGMFNLAKFKSKFKNIIFGWFFIAPMAAAPTTEVPHAIRTLVFLPTFQIFTAVGLAASYLYLKNLSNYFIRCSAYIIFIFLVTLNSFYYLNQYFIYMNLEVSRYWQYGYREAVDYTERVRKNYQKVVVSTALEQSYMFYLFYTRYDPVKYLALGGTKSGSFDEIFNGFENYEFRKINWPKEKRDGSILYVAEPTLVKGGDKLRVNFLDGTPAIYIAERE